MKTWRLYAGILLAAIVAVVVVFCVYISCGTATEEADAVVNAPCDANSQGNIKLSVSGLPPVVYLGERRNLIVTCQNESDHSVKYEIKLAIPGIKPTTRAISVAPKAEAVSVFPFEIKEGKAKQEAVLSLEKDGAPVLSKLITIVDGKGDLSGICSDSQRFRLTDGSDVLLLNEYEDESEYRRWAPIKWAVTEYNRHGAPRVLWAPCDVFDETDDIKLVEYNGFPLDALKKIESCLPKDGAFVLYLGWGFDEVYRRFPVESFTRALDLAIDRVRLYNPAVQIVLLTPPPIVGEESVTKVYAESIRNLAREHHVTLVDLYALTVAETNWQKYFSMEHSGNIHGLYPLKMLREKLFAWVKSETQVESPDEVFENPFRDNILAKRRTPVTLHCEFPGVAGYLLPGKPALCVNDNIGLD
ncbi:MAG: SGNH/GDSL hydrolase family protein, partial [Planctomycetes bacterium]|nr:SGNH/GDSL hydrolase family protein [Planctomycetota bacterium]